jgi:hypothetical protein
VSTRKPPTMPPSPAFWLTVSDWPGSGKLWEMCAEAFRAGLVEGQCPLDAAPAGRLRHFATGI